MNTNNKTIEAYPLTWPIGYERTASNQRKSSPFSVTPGKAYDELNKEVIKIAGYNNGLIISSNIPVRKDGFFYKDEAARKIEEPGIAIYFKYKGNQVSLCCDQYLMPVENIWALVKTINALRGIERWGVSDFLNKTFTGFKELPASSCWSILGIKETQNTDLIKSVYREKALKLHPDKGGNNDEFTTLSKAYDEAMKSAKYLVS